MNFLIKQNSTLPLLKIQIYRDGRSDFHYNELITNDSLLLYSMIDTESQIPKILNRPAYFFVENSPNGVSPQETNVFIQLGVRDTKKVGKFEMKLYLQNDKGTIMLDLTDNVYVEIIDSFVANNLSYSDDFVIENPCC